MTLEEYETLTGITVAESQADYVTAQIARTRRILETLLGYTLEPDDEDNEPRLENYYIETGIAENECSCTDIDEENLEPPDDVMYGYRLFPFNKKDKYLFTDPFTSVNKVKLVRDGITFKVYDENDIRVDYAKDGIAKYIELCNDCLCNIDCDESCVQLAVDADWCFETIPADLLDVWADMVGFYSNGDWNLKSQTVLGHSWTKADNRPPQFYDYNSAIIRLYAGPHGSVTRTLVV
jgi:hypothetical protein